MATPNLTKGVSMEELKTPFFKYHKMGFFIFRPGERFPGNQEKECV
jgi:hypothetical protein